MLWACSLSNYKIYTIFQKHTHFISRVYLTSSQNTPSEKYEPSGNIVTKCNYSHYTNTPRKQWNLKSAAKQSSRTCSCEHHISTSAADVPLFEAQFLGPFLYWEVSPRCCCLEGLHWLASLFKVIGHDLAPQFRERWHKHSRKCGFTAQRPLVPACTLVNWIVLFD